MKNCAVERRGGGKECVLYSSNHSLLYCKKTMSGPKASVCVAKYIKEIKEIRKKYNDQLDNSMKLLEELKKNRATPNEIEIEYKNIRQLIRNESIHENHTDEILKNCVCKGVELHQTGGRKQVLKRRAPLKPLSQRGGNH